MKLDSIVFKRERQRFLQFLKKHPYSASTKKMPQLADELSSLDLDHIPALKLMSGLQYQNYLLASVAYEISEFRAILPRQMKHLKLAQKALIHAQHINMDSIYLLHTKRINNLASEPLTCKQVKQYLVK